MLADLKKPLKAITLELRHLLEGRYENDGSWTPGDLEQRLAALGVRGDRTAAPVDELGHLSPEDRRARCVVDAYLKLREDAGVARSNAVAEFVRESAYCWANRLIALRCMEARDLIDPVILQQETYGRRSLEHHRLAQRQPELCAGEDDGLFAVLEKVFREQTLRLPMLFDPEAAGIALRPSPAVIKDCVGLLSLNMETLRKYRIRLKEDESGVGPTETPNPFVAPDALGWTYQYWNTEEKERVFEKVRTVKGAKIAGADIVPATQLYTEDYMVKFLVQNSLGATWMGMHPESKLSDGWEYYVRDADRAPTNVKPLSEITFLDPACGSGHFLLEAFDLYYAMYLEEGKLTKPEEICDAILTKNLYGIDIDVRAVQIAEAALWMKAAERSFDYAGAAMNLVAATSSHLRGPAWEEFLTTFDREPSVARVLRKFAQTMEHIDEIGSLARPAEDLQAIIREEHAAWEQQERVKRDANFLFAEMRDDALKGQLPFTEISDGEFAERLLSQAKAEIDKFTEQARRHGQFEDQMLGSETRTGFRLFDTLSRRYYVVATNPPYMGSKNMGPMLKRYVERNYTPGKRDLYAAFIVRCLELLTPCGMGAIVSMNKWMHARAYATLRCGRALSAAGVENGTRDSRNILNSSVLMCVSDLGSRAFDPENKFHDGVQVALFVILCCPPNVKDRVTLLDTRSPDGPGAKQKHLISLIRDQRFRSITQIKFGSLPGSPLISGLSDSILERLKDSPPFAEIARVRQGICTTNDPRFVRMKWETSNRSRWVTFAKAGGRRRWNGLRYFSIDWQQDGKRIKEYITDTPHAIHWSGRMPESGYLFKEGWAYSRIAYGSLGLRWIPATDLFGDTNPIILFDSTLDHEDVIGYGGLLNAPLTTFLLRAFTQSNDFREGYLARMPYMRPDSNILKIASHLSRTALASAETVSSMNPIECEFIGIRESRASVQEIAAVRCKRRMDSELIVSTCEILLELLAHEQWRLTESDRRLIRDEMGVLRLAISDESGIPAPVLALINKVIPLLSRELESPNASLDVHHTVETAAQFFKSRSQRDLEEEEKNLDPAEDDDDDGAQCLPVPTFGIVDRFARFSGLDVCTAYRGLNQFIEERGLWHDELASCIEVLCTDRICQLLGHRWPNQIEAGEPLPDWADPDGIIPLTALVHEFALVERVQERLRADEIETGNFRDLMGKPLDVWLATEFFKHHTKQFKKRPIAWQIQSGPYTIRQTPAFACLVYYHKLDIDAIPKLRSQYVGPLRQRLETELRGLQAIAAGARSERQEARRVELEESILELQKFDATLEQVAATGFGPPAARSALRQFALADAYLALKARWLRRLSEMIGRTALPEWRTAAERTGLHAEFGSWIAEAVSHLDRACSQVGPSPPKQVECPDDPTSSDLAALIQAQSVAMTAGALESACLEWWRSLDDALLAPLKEQIKELKAAQKQCEERLEADPPLPTTEQGELKGRIKTIKAEIKEKKTELDSRTAQANVVRKRIESWRSEEPSTWGDWLAKQPLFDQISSLDQRRPPPKTIAEFVAQESLYAPDINDGVRVNIAPLQKAGLLAADVLAAKDLEKAIADRAEWRADERRWVREGKLPQPGWWPEVGDQT